MADTQRRLSFADTSLHSPEFFDVQQLLEATRQPSLDRLQRALQLLEHANDNRFVKLKEAAVEKAAGGSEGDLRRLKRHFGSLKNTFILSDVRQSFIEGIAANYPDGSEEDMIAEAQKEFDKAGTYVTQQKTKNAELQKEIEGLIADIAVANKDFNGLKAEVGAHLECFAAEEAQRLASWPEPLPAHEDNLDQDLYQSRLAEEAASARALEAALAAEEAEAKELMAAIQAEEEQLHSLRTQIEEVESQSADDRTENITARLSESAAWINAVTQLTQQISGVEIVSASSSPVHLQLTTHYKDPTGKHGSSHCTHSLQLHVSSGACRLESAVLEPQDVPISDMTAAARDSPKDIAFLVRETQIRLAAHFARSAAIKEAAEKFEIVPVGEDTVTVRLSEGVTATLHVPATWPERGGQVLVTDLVTASGMHMSEEVVKKTQPPEGGRAGLLNSIEHLSGEIGQAFGNESAV